MAMDIYQIVTDKIVGMLETGVCPWRSPILGGHGSAGAPRNLISGRKYRGINTFLLAVSAHAAGYQSSYWMTFNQAKDRGGMVRKGQKSTMVVFFKMFETTDKKTGLEVKIPVLRYYNLFNLDQIDGIEAPDKVKFTPTLFSPMECAEEIVNGFQNAPTIAHDGIGRAFYRPATDSVHMPARERMASVEEYYSTLFHELSHSTGHSSRLDRKFGQTFGDETYGREELIAEMSAAFLCGRCGISPATIENSAAYLASWIKTLKGDKRLIVSAAAAAQKSADLILGETVEVVTDAAELVAAE